MDVEGKHRANTINRKELKRKAKGFTFRHMNFLAHAYLSFAQQPILIGNMISDFVKGKRQYQYHPSIQKGIRLHRAIDDFTDRHAATKMIREHFKSEYGLYAGPFADVAYDHFLAADENIFPASSHLNAFANNTYATLEEYQNELPENFLRIFPYMRGENWLLQYRTHDGIANAFRGLVRRAKYMHDANPAIRIFEANRDAIRSAYEMFFPEVEAFARNLLTHENNGEHYL